MKFTKETFRRAIRTFIQAFIAYIVGGMALIDIDSGKEALKTALIGLFISALAAGIAAVMNVEMPEQNSGEGNEFFYYNQNSYDKTAYPKPDGTYKTIATSGCGVVSSCIVLNNLAGKELYTVKQMAELSRSVGARDNDGTNVKVLLDNLIKKVKNLSYTSTTDEDKLIKHLKGGGMAICNQGDVYNIFSTSGHFVVARRMVGSNIEIVDPQMYSGKYDNYDRPKRIVKKTDIGCIVTPSELAKAMYYKVNKKETKKHVYFLVTYKKPEPTAPKIKNGKYTLTNVRGVYYGIGSDTGRKKVKELTVNGRINATSNKGEAFLKAGTTVSILETKVSRAGNLWARIPSGWICVWEKNINKKFVK